MGFFDNLGKKASAAYDATAEKTGKIAKEAKLRMKINENKSDINDIYKEIGRKVYEKHVREENIDIKTELEEECTKIDVLSAEIETCLKTILELKEKKQCEKCHAEIELDSTFCPKCGAKQSEAEVKEVEVVGAENAANIERDVNVENDVNIENDVNAETVIEDLENAEIKPENETEKKIVEEEVTGSPEEYKEEVSEDDASKENQQQSGEKENTVEKVTEIMAVETQEDAKEEDNK